jgi:hypothetical protein
MDEMTDHKPATTTASAAGWAGTVALVGFILVATARRRLGEPAEMISGYFIAFS